MATASSHGIDLDKPFSFAQERKRTVYLPVARNNLAAELSVFDGANPDLVSGDRPQTTVPTQALYLLNSDFVQEQAMALGKLAVENSLSSDGAVDWLYATVLARHPHAAETQRSLDFLAELGGASADRERQVVACGHLAHVLLASTEFLYLD
jgi:hypothetical protein